MLATTEWLGTSKSKLYSVTSGHLRYSWHPQEAFTLMKWLKLGMLWEPIRMMSNRTQKLMSLKGSVIVPVKVQTFGTSEVSETLLRGHLFIPIDSLSLEVWGSQNKCGLWKPGQEHFCVCLIFQGNEGRWWEHGHLQTCCLRCCLWNCFLQLGVFSPCWYFWVTINKYLEYECMERR